MKSLLFIAWITFLAALAVSAQSVRSLAENLSLKQFRNLHPLSAKAAVDPVLTLPFFEDFSNNTLIPDPDKWADDYAYINNDFPIEPISIGVATLDAIDELGNLYAVSDLPISSDKLTSRSFDLSGLTWPEDTVTMSFFYQSGGKGEIPDRKDSLLLEFFSPSGNRWSTTWFVCGDTATPFIQVILRIHEEYYQNGFKFRFRNYTSVSARDVHGGEGAVGNADCWNIDYIMINTLSDSSHQVINDQTLVEPPRYLLDLYETVPWLHLNDAKKITRNYMNYVIRDLNHEEVFIFERGYYAKNLQTGSTVHSEVTVSQIPNTGIMRESDPFFIPFARYDDSLEGDIEVGGFLVTPAFQEKQNDTARITLHFGDYYAYDDGVPEFGFGISGPSMAGALLAYRFRVFKSDTLKAVDMWFNKARDHVNQLWPFRLCVWNDLNGIPGDLLYMSPESYTPAFSDVPGKFERYFIDPETDLFIEDTIVYVGWKQETEEFLNLGFDVNRNSIGRIFVNTDGEWYNPGSSIPPGSLTMRAVFGSRDIATDDRGATLHEKDIIVFPNPVSDLLHIKAPDKNITKVAFFDATGRIVLQVSRYSEPINVSELPPGIYQLVIHTGQSSPKGFKIVIIP